MTITDGGWTLFSWDAETGRSVWSYFDGEKTVFRVDYPVDNLISKNEETRNSADQAWKGDWHRTASIPLNIYHDSGLAEAQQQGDDKFAARWLNDSDNRAWRTKDGRL